MKIYALAIETDLGRRTVQLPQQIAVDPYGDMPPQFRSLIEVWWDALREIAIHPPELTRPKAEA